MPRLPRSRRATRVAAFAAAALPCLASAATDEGCVALGLSPVSQAVLELRETGAPARLASLFRSADGAHWFLPLAQPPLRASPLAGSASCAYDGIRLWRVAAANPVITHDAGADTLTVSDPSAGLQLPGLRRVMPTGEPRLPGVGLNYQLAANAFGSELRFSGLAEAYAWHKDWYYATNVGLAPGRNVRFESYALREDLEDAVFLRLGDAVTAPTALGESLRFAGVAWGTDRNLQPADFAPVLPELRGGDVVSGPVELFINDNLLYQQTLQSGRFDLRNLPAQQGFNSYRVRTLDAQGNPVFVTREIYVPSTLLPPGALSWRLDAGWQRRSFGVQSFDYGPPMAAGNIAYGLNGDTTAAAAALATRDASTLSLEVDRRLTELWSGHIGAYAAHRHGETGHAWRARLEGGGRHWRVYTQWLHSPDGLPSLSPTRSPLLDQWLLRAQWTGLDRLSVGFTYARTHRLGESAEEVASLQATLSPWSSPAMLMLALSRLRSATGRQTSFTASLYVPLVEPNPARSRSLFANMTATEGTRISRVQYTDTDTSTGNGPNWSVGTDHDSRSGRVGADVQWSANTRVLELAATARTSAGQTDGTFSLRSGLLWADGARFATRPVTGAFAVVSTGQEGITVFHDNRPVAVTNTDGIAIVPSLRALESNRITLDPSNWPLHFNAAEVERLTVPPRGGGVRVSFNVSAQSWPADIMVYVPKADGQPYPAGTVVRAGDAGQRSTVVNSKGRIWVGDLLPDTRFTVRADGQACDYAIPVLEGNAPAATLVACREAR